MPSIPPCVDRIDRFAPPFLVVSWVLIATRVDGNAEKGLCIKPFQWWQHIFAQKSSGCCQSKYMYAPLQGHCCPRVLLLQISVFVVLCVDATADFRKGGDFGNPGSGSGDKSG
jgi:hypothetical protein